MSIGSGVGVVKWVGGGIGSFLCIVIVVLVAIVMLRKKNLCHNSPVEGNIFTDKSRVLLCLYNI